MAAHNTEVLNPRIIHLAGDGFSVFILDSGFHNMKIRVYEDPFELEVKRITDDQASAMVADFRRSASFQTEPVTGS